MLALKFKPTLERRLERLAKKTGQTKSFHAGQVISEHLSEIELAYMALEAQKNPGTTYSSQEIRRAVE